MQMLQATEDDFESLYAIILDRSRWLQTKGVPQWDPPYPKQRFENEIKDGQVYYFREEAVIGTVTLLYTRPTYYPADLWTDAKKSWYICRLATTLGSAGKNYGSTILDLIEEKARREEIQELRLDVVKSNPFLRSYYEKRGFKMVAAGDSHGTPSLFLEKRLDHLTKSPR